VTENQGKKTTAVTFRNKIANFTKISYGVKFVTLIMDDGSEYETYVA